MIRVLLLSGWILIYLTLPSLAQDKLAPLRYNEALRSSTKANATSSQRQIARLPFIYEIDTLPLPFFDDFSKNRTKVYDAQVGDENVSLNVLFEFSANGDIPATLEIKFDTTYSITKPLSGPLVYEANPPLFIEFYDSIGNPIDFDTAWTNVISLVNIGEGTITFDTLDPDDVLINEFDTLYLVDDDKTHWIKPGNEENRGGAYINNAFASNFLTQGVATFDGTDASGVPYDISSETTYGPADTLESKPFALDPEMEDVYLSFFYQAGGLGNAPDEEDSLIVDFFNVNENRWEYAWSTEGNQSNTDDWNDRVWLEVAGSDYKRPGFKFRFRNYATLSGILDQWHIDYVELAADRDTAIGDTINDAAFVTALSSFTGRYTSVPYKHYLEDYAAFQEDTVKALIRNLGEQAVNILNLDYEISSPAGLIVDQFTTVDPSLEAFTVKRYGFLQVDDQLFPDLGEEFVDFSIKSWFNISGGNDQRANDTITSVQRFHNYYAYDDGSAESAYSLRGAGAELGYLFNTPVGDSLRALYFNFPQTLNDDAEDFDIVLTVWNDTSSEPIFTADYISNPQYTYANNFRRYEINPPVYVEGDFMVGFQQLQADKLFIGYDLNNNARDKLFYHVNDVWYAASFNGALMLRPDFGEDPMLSTNELADSKMTTRLIVFPNPAENVIHVTNADSYMRLDIYSIDGSLLMQVSNPSESVDVSELSKGIYLLQATAISDQSMHTAKLIISQ